jgi:pyrroloquinoline-quinone synthase
MLESTEGARHREHPWDFAEAASQADASAKTLASGAYGPSATPQALRELHAFLYEHNRKLLAGVRSHGSQDGVYDMLRFDALERRWPAAFLASAGLSATVDQGCRSKLREDLLKLCREHRVCHHPIFQRTLSDGGDPQFWERFLIDSSLNNSWFNVLLARFLSRCSLSLRVAIIENLWDELGQGQLDDAHPNRFGKCLDAFGLQRSLHASLTQADSVEPFQLFDVYAHCCVTADDLFVGLGCLAGLELSMPTQMSKIVQGMEAHGLGDDVLDFWRLHIDVDEVHGRQWLDMTVPIVEADAQARSVLTGAALALEGRAGLYDGILRSL